MAAAIMKPAACVLLTTCNVAEDRRDLSRLWESIGAAIAGGEIERLRHFVLLQHCGPDELAEFQGAVPDWIELFASDTALSSARARNLLIAHYLRSDAFAPTAFVGFPDDDAWYPAGALACLAQHFGRRDSLQFLLARYGPDASARECAPLQRPTLQRVLSRGSCAAIFVRASMLERLGGFNELLGLGSVLSGGEDTEFSVRAFHLARGESAYLPQCIVGHAAADPAKKAKYYEGGLAAIMAHRNTSPAARIAFTRKLLVGVLLVAKRRLTWTAYVSAVKRARANFNNASQAVVADALHSPSGESVAMDRPASREPKPFLAKVRPEIGAGGFARDDGRIQFYSRVNALLEPDMTVIDLGAGRGSMFGSKGYAAALTKLQGKVARVVGIDVDDAIMDHPHLDERHVVRVSDPWPIETASVDVIVADWVLEHVSAPETLAAEAHRVLAPGGWLCARTPNKWGYVGIGARLVPNSLHVKVLRRIWPERTEIDVFPTEYKMNSLAVIRRMFPAGLWNDHSFAAAVSPRYHGNRRLLFWLFDYYQRLMPERLSTDLMIFLQKKP